MDLSFAFLLTFFPTLFSEGKNFSAICFCHYALAIWRLVTFSEPQLETSLPPALTMPLHVIA